MNLTDAQVRAVADLANLELSDDELHRMSHDLGQILTHMGQLNELNTNKVDPMAQVLYNIDADETATLREDIPHVCLSNDEALTNSPLKAAGYFKVPKVIER